ncbi:hypothetical protein VTK26DRAFT_2646 [Humicola hyalothermophila]
MLNREWNWRMMSLAQGPKLPVRCGGGWSNKKVSPARVHRFGPGLFAPGRTLHQRPKRSRHRKFHPFYPAFISTSVTAHSSGILTTPRCLLLGRRKPMPGGFVPIQYTLSPGRIVFIVNDSSGSTIVARIKAPGPFAASVTAGETIADCKKSSKKCKDSGIAESLCLPKIPDFNCKNLPTPGSIGTRRQGFGNAKLMFVQGGCC